jgi:sugar lactone lactonase YvrE
VRRLAVALLLGGLALPGAAAAARPRWDTRVFALIPRPGFPAHAYVHPNGRVYEGTYDNPAGDTVPSRVFEYEGDGTLLRSWTVEGQDLSGAHGVQVATSDARGRLVLLDKSPARVLLLDRSTGHQTTYATFPAGAAVPNYAAWGRDGSLYVTDYEHATLWRVPPGGGTPQPWLRDSRLDGGPFGTTGIALAADRSSLVVGMQSEAGGSAGNPATGRLWTVPIGADGKPGPLRLLWESGPADGPDGFAIARSGAIYVALLVTNQLAVVGPDGTERERFPALPGTGANGSAVPFDNPSSVRFLGTRLVVANQAYVTGDATHQAILDVESGEEGLPEMIPPNAGGERPIAQPKARKKPKPEHGRRKTGRRAPRPAREVSGRRLPWPAGRSGRCGRHPTRARAVRARRSAIPPGPAASE